MSQLHYDIRQILSKCKIQKTHSEEFPKGRVIRLARLAFDIFLIWSGLNQ